MEKLARHPTRKPKKGARSLGRPSKEEAQKITADLLDTALLLFSRQGYAATSIDQIVAESHASKHTVYRRYKTKGELLAAVMDMARARVFRAVLAPKESKSRAVVVLKQACVDLLDRITEEENIEFYRVSLSEGRNFPEIANKAIAGPNPVIEAVENLVLKAQKQGDLRPGDTHFMAHQLLHLVATIPTFRLLLQSDEFSTPAKRRTYIAKTWELFMRGAQTT